MPVHFNNKKTVSDTLLRWLSKSNSRGLKGRGKMGSKKSWIKSFRKYFLGMLGLIQIKHTSFKPAVYIFSF
jgi:hypothetical protein